MLSTAKGLKPNEHVADQTDASVWPVTCLFGFNPFAVDNTHVFHRDGVKFASEGISGYRFALLFQIGLGTKLLPRLLEQYSSGVFLFNYCSSLLDFTLTLQSCKFILITLNNSSPASQKTLFYSSTKSHRLALFREIISLFWDSYESLFWTKFRAFYCWSRWESGSLTSCIFNTNST